MGKQNKKKAIKQVIETPSVTQVPKQVVQEPSPEKGRQLGKFIIPVSGLAILIILLIGTDQHTIMNAWTRADMLCDSASKMKDNPVKTSFLAESGELIRTQVALHPYHARVWAIYGHYLATTSNWDSCIIAERKALTLGRGSTVNSIEPMAKYFMNIALKYKMEPIYKQKETALKVLEDIEIPGYDNDILHKFRGFVYVNNGDFFEAVTELTKFLAKKPDDYDALYAMAVNYTNKGMKAEALSYAYKARAVKPNSEQVQRIISVNSQ